MSNDYAEIVLRLIGALAAGGMIGLERSYMGGPPASAPMRWYASRRAC